MEPKIELKKEVIKPKSFVKPTIINFTPVVNTTEILETDQTEPEQEETPIETKPEPTVDTTIEDEPYSYKNLWKLDEKSTLNKCVGLKGLERDNCFNKEMSRFLKTNWNILKKKRREN